MSTKSRVVTSTQKEVHQHLARNLSKHLTHRFRKPQRPFSAEIFYTVNEMVRDINLPVILDSGCGTGESSEFLSKQHNDALIVGIDKSKKRLGKFTTTNFYQQKNLILIRADVIDMWRMIKQADWNISKHYLLYPNPWPKADQLKRRWHGHPVFPLMLSLSQQIELRTNWQIYAEEFKFAIEKVTLNKAFMEVIKTETFISPFEKKYYLSGHTLYRIINNIAA